NRKEEQTGESGRGGGAVSGLPDSLRGIPRCFEDFFRKNGVYITMWITLWKMCRTLPHRRFYRLRQNYFHRASHTFFESCGLFCQEKRGKGPVRGGPLPAGKIFAKIELIA